MSASEQSDQSRFSIMSTDMSEPPRPPPPRPAKRMRQRLACEPCRRKKSKCDYQRPACGFCSRLHQTCYFADDGIHHYVAPPSLSPRASADIPDPSRSRHTEERLQFLESRLAEVIGTAAHQPNTVPGHALSPVTLPSIVQRSPGGPPSRLGAPTQLPAWDIVHSAAGIYLECCDCQPLPLFHTSTFLASLPKRDPEVLFSILALALRFSHHPSMRTQDCDESCRDYAEAARRLIMARVLDGPVELSTLQCLCLLSLVDFTNGNKNRASIHSSLAMNLAHCAGLTTESPANLSEAVREERRRCFWSIFLLKRLHGADVNVLDFSGEENFPWYPKTTGIAPGVGTAGPAPIEVARNGELKDLGIVAYAVQQSEVWFKTTRYARRRATPSAFPPWSPQSEYAIIVAQTMDFETRMPSKHRYKPSGFLSKTPEELQTNRAYWAPWLFTQFVYHTNLCLLNHPLILALRLRNFKHSIPEMFLQDTSGLISTHAGWIVYLIDTLAEKSFKVTDPFLGYCAAIIATIFLQESFSEDEMIRKEKQINFGKCFNFIRSFAQEWPHIARLSSKLQQLQDTVSASYQTSSNTQVPSRGLLVDLGRFWEVLEYSSASELYDSASQLFGSSLYSRPRQAAAEVTDMSTLPTPTRLEAAAGLNRLRDTAYSPQSNAGTPNSQTYKSGGFDNMLNPEMNSASFNYGYMPESIYSHDELAVLADSFFNQRENFIGSVDEWWKTGNL